MPLDADGILRPSFKVGDKVDYVYRGLRGGSGPGGMHGSLQGSLAKKIDQAGDQAVKHAFSKALEEKEGVRRRGQVDAVISDEEIRLVLENGDLVWAHPSELDRVDAVSALGDIVGPRSRSFKDALDEIEDEAVICTDCKEPIKGSVWWASKEARCTGCRNKKLGLA